MSEVVREVRIAAPPRDVWSILTRLDEYPEWEGGYVSAEYVGESRKGRGARREVRLKSPMGVRTALHEITKWDPERSIAWRAIESNFPMLAAAEQTVTLTADGDATRVTNRVEYRLSGGPLGKLMDKMMFRRVVAGANDGFVDALRMAVEKSE